MKESLLRIGLSPLSVQDYRNFIETIFNVVKYLVSEWQKKISSNRLTEDQSMFFYLENVYTKHAELFFLIVILIFTRDQYSIVYMIWL